MLEKGSIARSERVWLTRARIAVLAFWLLPLLLLLFYRGGRCSWTFTRSHQDGRPWEANRALACENADSTPADEETLLRQAKSRTGSVAQRINILAHRGPEIFLSQWLRAGLLLQDQLTTTFARFVYNCTRDNPPQRRRIGCHRQYSVRPLHTLRSRTP